MATHLENRLGETICGNGGDLVIGGEAPSCLICFGQTLGARPSSVPTQIYPPGDYCADCGQTFSHWPGCKSKAKRKKPKALVVLALIVVLALAGCGGSGGSGGAASKPDQNKAFPPGTLIKDMDGNYTTTFCDHGNRVYRAGGGGQSVAVISADPSCMEAQR